MTPGKAPKVRDVRRSGKKCAICGLLTNMGVRENKPPLSRERWDGKQYVRFCGPECEAKGGW